MAIILIRTIILYSIALFTIRIMGKSELSKMSPFQMVIIFMIAELAAIPISTPSASLVSGIVAICTLMFLQVLISMLAIKSEKIKNFINGKPSILIENGEIKEKELRHLRITINDLLEQLRIGNTSSLADVAYAVMEGNGELSIILKPEKRPLTPSDMGIAKQTDYMPLMLISDGVLHQTNLNNLGWSEDKLKTQLKAMNIQKIDDVFLAFSDETKNLHVYLSADNGSTAREVTVCAT